MTITVASTLALAVLLSVSSVTTLRGQATTPVDASPPADGPSAARAQGAEGGAAGSDTLVGADSLRSDSLTLATRLEPARPETTAVAAFPGALAPATPVIPAALAARVVELVRQGDQASTRLEPAAALQAYQAAVSLDPSSYEALWKAGRTLIDLGELDNRGNPQKDKYNKALKYADRAVKVNPDGSDGHYVRAYALERVALYEGGRTKLRLAREIKTEALRAIDLDPLQDGAYHVLGTWNYGLADMSFIERVIAKTILGGVPDGASFENAAHYFQLAIQARPDRIEHRLAYARTLLKLDRKDEAKAELERILAMPPHDLDDPTHKREAERLVERLG